MTPTIAGIEDSIKHFFENRIQISSSLKKLATLSKELAGSINTHQNKKGNNLICPNIFNVSLGKNFEIPSEIMNEWVQFAYRMINEIIIENAYQLNGPLMINLSTYDNQVDEFKIIAGFSSLRSGNTIPIRTAQKEKHENEPFGHLDFVDGEYFDLVDEITSIGRDEHNLIVLDNLRISRSHAKILKEDKVYKIIDISSTTGTFVNGNRIQSHILNNGDVIRFGDLSAIFSIEETEPSDPNFITRKLEN